MTKRKLVTRWVTKYALTQGIVEVRGVVLEGYFYYGGQIAGEPDGGIDIQVGLKDAHDTLNGAICRATALRDRRAASLRKQLAKLESMTFLTDLF